MTTPEDVARAIAFFQSSDDLTLLRRLLEEIASRARRMVEDYMKRGGEDAVPPPAEIPAASEPATREEALRTLAVTNDFALLQALSRAIGRRVETLQQANGSGHA